MVRYYWGFLSDLSSGREKVGSEGMSEYNKSKISLAVIDSGVNLQHPDFKDDAI